MTKCYTMLGLDHKQKKSWIAPIFVLKENNAKVLGENFIRNYPNIDDLRLVCFSMPSNLIPESIGRLDNYNWIDLELSQYIYLYPVTPIKEFVYRKIHTGDCDVSNNLIGG